jgi:polyphosphate kinase
MKRIGGLKQQHGAGIRVLTVDGRTPRQQIDESYTMVRALDDETDFTMKKGEHHGVSEMRNKKWILSLRHYCAQQLYCQRHVLSALRVLDGTEWGYHFRDKEIRRASGVAAKEI